MSEETCQFGQTVAEIDALEEQLDEIETGDRVRLTWTSSRSKNERSAEGTAAEHPVHGICVQTDDLKGDIIAHRNGKWEITVRSETSRQGQSLGWLVDLEFLDRSGGDGQ